MPVPAPPSLRQPRPVQAVRFAHSQKRFFEKAAHLGDVFQVNFQRRRWNVFTHPDAVKEVFTAPSSALHAGKGNDILATALGEHSVLILDEDEHMRHRKLLLPSFHGERLQAQAGTIQRIAEQEVERMPRDGSFSMRDHSQAIALEVILEIVLGTESTGSEHDELAGHARRTLEWIGRPFRLLPPGLLGPRHPLVRRMYRPVLDPLDESLYRLIAERRQEPDLEEREDMLSMLLTARDEEGRPMSDEEVRDEIVTLIVAGHETTATALAWAFERLAHTEGSTEALHQAVAGGDDDYVTAVAQETLRLRPVLDVVVRQVNEPIEIAGYSFERGEMVVPCIHLVHRREDVYPDPLEFKPSRWKDEKPGTYTWIPFGGGVRRCIGASFAMAEMEIVMKAVARAGVLEPVGDDEEVVQRFITSSPARGGELRFAI
ncbi:MAG: cytochrome P450 [Solirubrobacterales bacterium]